MFLFLLDFLGLFVDCLWIICGLTEKIEFHG